MNNGLDICEITSNSMSPLLRTGDTVLVQRIKTQNEISIGDCLIFKTAEGKSICHRLIKIRGKQLYLKGDNSAEMDYPVLFSDVLAKAIAIKKKDKLIFLNTPTERLKAELKVFLFLTSCKFGFKERLIYALSLPPKEFTERLLKKISRTIKKWQKENS